MTFATFQIYDNNTISVTLVEGSDGISVVELNGFLEALESLVNQGTTFSLIIDASKVVTSNLGFATRIADFMQKNREAFKARNRATAMIIHSPIVRSVVNAVFALQPPDTPFKIVTTSIEAHAFLLQ